MKEKNYEELISTLVKMRYYPNHGNRRDFFNSLETLELMVLWSKLAEISDSEYRERFGNWRNQEFYDIFNEMILSDSGRKLGVYEKASLWKMLGINYLIRYLSEEVFDVDKSVQYLIKQTQSVAQILQPEEILALKEYFVENLEKENGLYPQRIIILLLLESKKETI